MFNKIFVEKELINSEYAQNILTTFKKSQVVEIDDYTDYFGSVKKPYLQKRDNLNLFIASKKGSLLKEAPDAYGLSGEPHYYYVHAYNCIYECSYCYLQGYFNSPDMVLFVNHEEILQSIKEKIETHQAESETGIWFHAGEFSDSLALSHVTKELKDYYDLFKNHPKAFLELRTKSANIKEIEKLDPIPNMVTSFSLSPDERIKSHDYKTPSLQARLKAISKLHQQGHPIGIHLDPIIYADGLEDSYAELLDQLNKAIPLEKIEYISVGVVRFTKDVYNQVKMNYPESEYFHSELIKGHDGKIKYPRPMRHWILNRVRHLCISKGADADSVYLCMED
jgi:spore photoproduct lyase